MSESKTAHRDRYYHPSDINDRSQGIEQSEWDAEYTPSDLLPSATFDGRVDNQINVLPFRLRMGRPESGDGTVTPNKPNETASINVTYGSLPSGTYGIINTKYHHLLTLPSRNAGTNVVGVSPSENGGIYDKWKIPIQALLKKRLIPSIALIRLW
ncbi:hypothetical protein BV22DRAFT_411775 [Leucogyrophana mollusca]|uniref:Uncharacterized protein n=1 Tax=Leucogyrophana mollusca TaxID=85980 RepID=A0ACB8BKH9_9AGAM|nr:hypothetical protein BV22DRAFT_411775 [Leucogyrophana mollusca]